MTFIVKTFMFMQKIYFLLLIVFGGIFTASAQLVTTTPDFPLEGKEVTDKPSAASAIEEGYIIRKDGKLAVAVPAFTKEQYERFTKLAEEIFAPVIGAYAETVRNYAAGYKKLFPAHLEDDVDRACNYMFLTMYAVDICDLATEQGLLMPPAKGSICDVLVQYK